MRPGRGGGYWRAQWLLLPFLLGTAPSAHATADWNMASLMRALASSTHATVAFEETRVLAYLEVALTSHGVLSMTPDGQLIKETVAPHQERLVVESDKVRSLRAGEDEVVLQLSDVPVLRGFVEAFRATLQGDQATLSRYYQLELQGSEEGWLLQLRPQQASLGAVIRMIDVAGVHARVTSYTVTEQSGDVTTMALTVP
jgi:hypothetical protein